MADEHTGGMLALVPDRPQRLAIDGGEDPSELHLTLLYLGDDVAEWGEGQADRLRELVAASAPALDAVDARIIGPALFNPDGGPDGDRDPCLVLIVADSPELNPLRKWAQWVTTTHDDYPDPPEQFEPFLPHLTLAYGDVASYGYAEGDSGSGVAEDSSASNRGSRAEVKRLPRLRAEPGLAAGCGIDPERQQGPPSTGNPSDSSSEAWAADTAQRGRTSHLSDEAMRGSGAFSSRDGDRPFSEARGGTASDTLLGAPGSVLAQGGSRVGGVPAVSTRSFSSLAGQESRQSQSAADRDPVHSGSRSKSSISSAQETKDAHETGIARLISLAAQTYTGPVRFSTLRLALAGDVYDFPLGQEEAPVITETKTGEITFTPPQHLIDAAMVLPGPVARVVAEGKALNSRGVDWVAENCGTEGAAWATEMRARAGEIQTKSAKSMNMGKRVTSDGDADDDPALQSIDDLHNAINTHHKLPPDQRRLNARRLKGAAKRLGADHHVRQRVGSLETATTDGSGTKDAVEGVEVQNLATDAEVKIASPDPRAARLREEWAHNPKLTKKWRPGTPGDFKRLRRHLAKYVHTPRILNGLVANVHKLATGEWPGKNAHTGKGNVGKAMRVGVKSLLDWDAVEFKSAPVLDDADEAALFEGIENWGEAFAEAWTDGYVAALEESDTTPDTPSGDTADDVIDTARHASIGARMVVDDTPASSTSDVPETDSGTTTVDDAGTTEQAQLFDAEPAGT